MKAKKFIFWLAVSFLAIFAYQLSLTFVASSEDAEIAEICKNDPDKIQRYKDSIADQDVFLWNSYESLQKNRLNLGLDLQGGMNVVMEVSVSDVIKGLAKNSTEPYFVRAIQKANELQKNSQKSYVASFVEAFHEVNPGMPLNRPFVNLENSSKNINSTTPDEAVEKFLNDEAKQAIDNSLIVLRNRIDKFGVTSPNIRRQQGTGRILIELAGVDNPTRVRRLLQTAARLEFWETYEGAQIINVLGKANDAYNAKQKIQKSSTSAASDLLAGSDSAAATTDTATTTADDLLAGAKSSDSTTPAAKDTAKKDTKTASKQEPGIFKFLQPAVYQAQGGGMQAIPGPVVGSALLKDTFVVNRMLEDEAFKNALPRDVKLLWTVKPEVREDNSGNKIKLLSLVAIKANTPNGEPPLDGTVITDANRDVAANGSNEVNMTMNAVGAQKWAELTGRNAPKAAGERGNSIAIVLDNYVYSFPTVNQQITGGRSNITGNFTVEEAGDLANVLKSGKLPAPARIIEESVVGPSLGEEAISAGVYSSIFGFLIVLAFMAIYYRKAGMVAVVALLVNFVFIIGSMAVSGSVLTLPGIAGIVLSMGMAVDANVLIYERIKEELDAGVERGQAIKDGFFKALSAIIDSNVTTFLTGLILFGFGTGPILGFATTLLLGILTSLFCGIFITRLIIEWMLDRGQAITFIADGSKGLFANANYRIIYKRKYLYIFSAVFLTIGGISLYMNGLNWGVDFSGGRTYTIQLPENVKATDGDLRKGLNNVFKDASCEVKSITGGTNRFMISTKAMVDSNSVEADRKVEEMLYDGMATQLAGVTKEEFVSTDKYIVQSRKVGPSIADDLQMDALKAIFFAIIAIGIYLLIRFRKISYSIGAAVALLHDALFVISIYSLLYKVMPFALEIDQNFIAAILTIVGYSVNDTVVVFDRLREYLRETNDVDSEDTINEAVNSTLGRTVVTALATMFTLVVLLIFGGEALRSFSFCMLIGLIIGTYSSIFIASSIVTDLSGKKKKSDGATVEA